MSSDLHLHLCPATSLLGQAEVCAQIEAMAGSKRLSNDTNSCCCSTEGVTMTLAPGCKKAKKASIKPNKSCPYCGEGDGRSSLFTHTDLTKHVLDNHLPEIFSNCDDSIIEKLETKSNRAKIQAKCSACQRTLSSLFNIAQHGLKCQFPAPLSMEIVEHANPLE
ncbi:hypothetical protein RCL1_005673 [Eukaryota sp. TZLM3-RCL]